MPLYPNFGGLVAGTKALGGSQTNYFPARVKQIVLQPSNDPTSLFAKSNGYTSFGNILFHPIGSVVDTENQANFIASPLDVNIKRIPLINEVVLILASTDILNENPQKQKYYYLSGVNIWNSIHHNAFPDLQNLSATKKSETQVGLLSTQAGIIKKPSDLPKDLFLGNTVSENPDIRNLFPIEGDVSIEGRFGQSIRFSHTSNSPSQSVTSPWSKVGPNTSPITIIRNGQTKKVNSIRWTPIFEDIDGDASSIYLTNGQEIQMTLASRNLLSYGTAISSSAPVVTVPSIVPQPANRSVVESDQQELQEIPKVSTDAVPSSIPVTASLTPTGSAPATSTTTTPPPTSSVSPTVNPVEKSPAAGPGSSKVTAIPEGQLSQLTWAGEEISPLDYQTDYQGMEEDESQFWDPNPPALSLPSELERSVLPAKPPKVVETGGTEGPTVESTPLTAEELKAATDLAGRSGLDIVPGSWVDNDKKSITLAVIGSQTLQIDAAKAYIVMVAAAKKDGVTILASSGFRPPVQTIFTKSSKGKELRFASQLSLREPSRWRCKRPYNQQEALTADTSCFSPATAPPYKSRHGNGIAVDINTGGFSAVLPSTGALTSTFVWMALHGWKYGFVRSVKSETWHFEYWPTLAPKGGPYVKLGGKADANYSRTMTLNGTSYNLANIKVA